MLGCLALNSSFEPLTMVPLRRALRLVIDGKAEIVEADHEALVRSERLAYPRPIVIRLAKFIHVPRRFRRQVTNTFLFARDRYTCQYCGKTLNSGELTLDHVIPRSRSGETTWENLVACCHPCNNKKGNRTPEETGMRLARQPKPFSLHTSRHLMRLLGKSDDQWRKYLFY